MLSSDGETLIGENLFQPVEVIRASSDDDIDEGIKRLKFGLSSLGG